MPSYIQAERPLSVTTPLGQDVLLLTGLRGHEAISQLFNFHLDLMAELSTEVHFDQILGQNVTVEMRLLDGGKRYFNGIVKRFSQGSRDENFVKYRAEVVPKLWLLTKNVRSRTFQHKTIPKILQQVLTGLDVTYELAAEYYERDYCVQYRESDFAFASRLMEEEGIYYFFKHSDGSHQMVVTDIPAKHPTVPGPATAIYDEVAGEDREDMRVTAWEKSQELRSGECTLWDQCFELFGNPLEAQEKTIDSVAVGKVVHKLKVGGNDQLEIYDYPGGYAQRFDGINRAGGDRPVDIQHIFEDRTRTVRIRMEQEEVRGLEIAAEGDCGHFTSGHEFTLDRHFDANGKYLLTRVEHDAKQGDYRSEQSDAFSYHNHFTCIPSALRYRPARVTPRPAIAGVQTATVVGPVGEEIFVDKYGRVKVQFPWDREGKKNLDSSCWLRVGQIWAGNRWGAFFWPRIGHEVIVSFEDGDPDRPIVVGSVYNATNMPPFLLPIAKMFGGIKSESVHGTASENYNGVVFVDLKGLEHLAIHSERHMILNAEFDVSSKSGRHQYGRVSSAHGLTVGSLPGKGGGSGGGPTQGTASTWSGPSDTDTSPKPSGQSWGAPHPQATLGLSATTVYGSAFTSSFPLSFQLAFGSLSKLIVDPVGFSEVFPGIPGSVTEALAGGGYGSAQLTLGTFANIVMGQKYDINIGPPKIHIESYDKTGLQWVARILGTVILVLAVVYLIKYDEYGSSSTENLQTGDDKRTELVIEFQIAIQLCICTLIAISNLHVNNAERIQQNAIDLAYSVAEAPLRVADISPWGKAGLVAAAAVIALPFAVVLPYIWDSKGEKTLDALDKAGKG